jgi:hypothetical protein
MAGSIKVQLAKGKTSYWDPHTRTYLTLDRPAGVVNYDDSTDLSRICRAIFGMRPALVLLEGQIPQAELDKWESRYRLNEKRGMIARSEAINNHQTVSPVIEERKDAFQFIAKSEDADVTDGQVDLLALAVDGDGTDAEPSDDVKSKSKAKNKQ